MPLAALRISAFVTLLLAVTRLGAGAQEIDPRAATIQQQVEALATAADMESRRAVIVARLESIGLQPQLHWFDPPARSRVERRGANVVAAIPGTSTEVLLLGAHYDHLGGGQGVIDNGAGVAAVLHLAEAFARDPLHNFTVRVALFDLEEYGLLGSRAMVRDSAATGLPRKFVNFDVFGYGDAFWAAALDASAPFPSALRDAATQSGWVIVVDSLYPPSDHLSFRGTSTKSYSVSIVHDAEIQAILPQLRGDARATPAAPPRIMQILHTPEDTMDKLDAGAMARALIVVEQAIRRMDAARH